MEKLEVINSCDCLNRMIIIGYLKEYEKGDNTSNYYLEEIKEGQICMKRDITVDNGEYNEDGEYIPMYDITSSYYPVDFCPICGKKIEYIKIKQESLKLV